MVNELVSLNDNDKLVNWFENIIHKHRWTPSVLSEIKDRVQVDINTHFLTSEELDELGQRTWDDWTSFDNIIKNHPLPAIEIDKVKWSVVGQLLVDGLKLQLWEHEEDDED